MFIKFLGGATLIGNGAIVLVTMGLRYPFSFSHMNDIPDIPMAILLLSTMSIGFGLWMIGDYLKSK